MKKREPYSISLVLRHNSLGLTQTLSRMHGLNLVLVADFRDSRTSAAYLEREILVDRVVICLTNYLVPWVAEVVGSQNLREDLISKRPLE